MSATSAMSEAGLSASRPFPGLRPFGYADHAYFFGRTDQTYALYRMLDRGRFAAVVGSSGSGKSSLVFAGLLPLLDRESGETGGRQWVWRDMSPGDAPLERLIDVVCELSGAPATGNDRDGGFATGQRDRIAYLIRHSSHGLVDALAEIESLQDKTLILVVDQFEELFRYATSANLRDRSKELKWREEAVLFTQLLLVASRDTNCSARFVLTMRSDFIGDCARFQDLPEAVSQAQFLVPSLRRDQIEEIIVKPVAKAGSTIDPMLVKRLLTDADDEFDQLPVLQHCLARLWERAAGAVPDGARSLRLEHYDQIGRMSGALSRHADGILSEDLAGMTSTVARIFRALSELDKEGRAIRRIVPFAQLVAETGAEEEVVRGVADRLRSDDCAFLRPSPIRVRRLGPDSLIDVGHEALLRRWERISGVADATGEPNDPRPIGWLREEEADGRRYQALRSIARADRAGRTVLPPEQIEWWDACQPRSAWAERYGGGYKQVAALVERSRAALATEEQKREHETAARRRAGLVRIAAVALSLMLLIAAVGGWQINKEREVAELNSRRASEQARHATRLFKIYLDQVANALNYGKISVSAADYIFQPVEDYLAQSQAGMPASDVMELNVQLLTTYSDVQATFGRNEQALKFAIQAEDLAGQLVKGDPANVTWQLLLFGALFRTADAVIVRGETADNLRDGLIGYKEALEIARKLRDEKPDVGSRQYDLAFISNKVGETLQLQAERLKQPAKITEAMTYFDAALKAARILAALEPGDVLWKAELPTTLVKIGSALASQTPPDLSGALDRYKEALDLQQQLAKRYPDNFSIMSNIARTQGLIGSILLRRGGPDDFEHAIKAYQDAIAINELLRDRDPDSALWLGFLASKYAQYGNALKDHSDYSGALVQYRKERDVRSLLVTKDPTKTTWKANLAASEDRIADLIKLQPRTDAAPATAAGQ